MVNTLHDKNASSILLVRPGALGDTILTVPLVESIRRTFPRASITWLGTGRYRSIVPPGIEFEAFDDPRRLWMFASETAPIPDGAPRLSLAYVILNNPHRVIRNIRRAGAKNILHVTSTPPEETHIVDHIHHGLALSVPRRKPALLHLSSERKQDMIWVHPGSGGPAKCIPPEWVASVVNEIKLATGWAATVTVGEEDLFLKKDPAWKSLTAGGDTRLLDCRPLSEVCRELAGARLFIGNDCGISHLAAGLGIPGIVFFSATSPAQWAPWTEESLLMIRDLREETRKPEVRDILKWVSDTC